MLKLGNFAKKISNKNRCRKLELFLKTFEISTCCKILDVGASEKEHQEHANILEKKYPYPENITALGVEKYDLFCKRYPKVKAITYDGKNFPFEDKSFDICWCNAVIEHVGDRENQEYFLGEIKRVAKSAFVTTPNRFFPFEVHTKLPLLHFLPKRIFDEILILLNKSWATGDYMHLLSLGDIKKLLEKSGISEYKVIKNKILGFTVDFVIIF